MTAYPSCEIFQITPKEIEARRIFLGLTPEDETRLTRINQVIRDEIDDIVAEFYDRLLRFDELRRFFGDRRRLERLQATQKLYLLSLGQQAASVTLSIGMATMTPSGDQIEALVERADRALYQAKVSERNQICVSREEG